MPIVRQMESQGTEEGTPKSLIWVTECGQLDADQKAQVDEEVSRKRAEMQNKQAAKGGSRAGGARVGNGANQVNGKLEKHKTAVSWKWFSLF